MKLNNSRNRRDFIKKSMLAAMAPVALSGFTLKTEGKIRHSACKWCYRDISLEDLASTGKTFGLSSVELVGPAEWEVLKKYGMTCAIGSILPQPFGISKCLNRTENHSQLYDIYAEFIPLAAKYGIPSLIVFSGNREGMDDEQGLNNCAAGLEKLMPLAEKYKVSLMMELLNSKLNHPDYQCDYTSWGVELCKKVGSERFKLLYDIYHMQIMEGNVIDTIRKNHQYIGHYHTGGVPGRAEIDETQELNYPAIVKAIAETGYEGFIGQEFIPKRPEKLKSLQQAVGLCTVA
jgi:hydroxypyruvate isomerase